MNPEPVEALALPAVTVTHGEFAVYRGQAEMILGWAREHTITDTETLGVAIAKVGEIAVANRTAESKRKALVDGPNRWVKAVNDSVKWVCGPLAEAELLVKSRIANWQKAERDRIEREQREAQAEERHRREKADRLAREAATARAAAQATEPKTLEDFFTQFDASTEAQAKAVDAAKVAAQPIIAPPTPPKSVTVGGTTATLRESWTFEVVNLADVPRAFLVLDAKKVRDAIAGGARDIPGIKVFQESSVAVRGR